MGSALGETGIPQMPSGTVLVAQPDRVVASDNGVMTTPPRRNNVGIIPRRPEDMPDRGIPPSHGYDELAEMRKAREHQLFGPFPQPATEARPGLQERGNFRTIFEDGASQSIPKPEGKNPLLSPADYARAALLMQQFAALIQNTNITTSLPAHNAPNLWSEPIDLSGQIVVPATVGVDLTVLSYRVQPGRWARITGYGVDVSAPAAYGYDGSLLWTVKKNGIPVQTLDNWTEHRGSVIRPRETFVLLNGDNGAANGGGDIITFSVRRAVAAGVPATVQMALTGYTWRPRNNYEGTRASVSAF